jgi:hypothetical protein
MPVGYTARSVRWWGFDGVEADLVDGYAHESVEHFDFAINEKCLRARSAMSWPRPSAPEKIVFTAEYELDPADFCPDARAPRFSSIHKTLDAWCETC